MFTQTAALLLDAYRELQARKLFWATLILSAIVAGAFGCVGINAQGIQIFRHTIAGPWNSGLIPPSAFYQYLFTTWAIPGWLGFLATILALLAVGGIFPDLLGGGSIELYLSKPIGRLRLFLIKYLFALIFTAAQVFSFCIVAYIIIGVRGGSWDWRIFLAVPLVTLLFSYLYSICVLFGVMWRSTLMAILLTLLIWAFIFLASKAEVNLTRFAVASDLRTAKYRGIAEYDENLLVANHAKPATQQSNLTQFKYQSDVASQNLLDAETDANELHWWQHLVQAAEAPLPKLSETVNLMSRWLVNPAPILRAQSIQRQRQANWRQQHGFPRDDQSLASFSDTDAADAAMTQELRGRTLLWVLGTSIGFEVAVLALAAWVFCRRDY